MIISDTFRRTIKGSGYLSSTEILVFDALISYANANTGVCFPKINTLVDQCQKSAATIRRALNELVKKEVVTKKARFNPIHKGQTSNFYALNLNNKFWNDKANTYLEQKNKGCHLPSETLYHINKAKDDDYKVALAKSYNNPYTGVCQTENRPETAKTAPAEPKKARKAAISAPKETPKEKICMEQIKLDFKYDDLLKACPGNESIIAPLFDVLHSVLNTNKQNIKINKGNQKPTAWVIDRIKRLTADNLAQIIERIAAGTEKIKNIGAYLLTCLCGFIDVAPINKQRATNAETVAPGADHENMTASAAEPDSINSRAGQSTTAARSNTLAYYQRRQQPTALRTMIECVNRDNPIDLDAMISADPFRFRRPRTAPTV